MTGQVTPIVAVGGTWASKGDDQWWQPDSAWWRYLRRRGFDAAHLVAATPQHPFEWDTDLGSSFKFWKHWWPGRDEYNGWKYGGYHLADYLDALPYDQRVVVAHSHGGQLAFYAAKRTPIYRLLTLSTPRRLDVQQYAAELALQEGLSAPREEEQRLSDADRDRLEAARARRGIGTWWHVYASSRDWVAKFGGLGDGRLTGDRSHPGADQNVLIPGIGHSKLVSDPAFFHVWDDQQLVAFLKREGDA